MLSGDIYSALARKEAAEDVIWVVAYRLKQRLVSCVG